MIQNRYSLEELYNNGSQKIYKGKYLNQISFPLGGIGTGSIGLSGCGSLKDFEIFNRPNVGSWFPKTFPLIWLKQKNQNPICRVLEGPLLRPYTPRDGGAFHENAEGFPHMDRCEFRGEYPFAWIDFSCDKMPLKIQLEAYNPFIPSDPDSSSYPAAILKYHITSTSDNSLEVSVLWSLLNIVGLTGQEGQHLRADGGFESKGQFYIESIENDHIKGIFFGNNDFDSEHPKYGSMTLTTPDLEISYVTHWKKDFWFTPHYDFWHSFKKTGKLIETKRKVRKQSEAGAIAILKTISPGETQTYTFYITWFFPNFVKYWHFSKGRNTIKNVPVWKNYYASLFNDAFDVVTKLHQQEHRLYKQTKLYHDALFSSTLPPYVIDAIASNTSTLKTSTCLRLPDGTFYGWEGCSATQGSCEGSCTHVWGYQQALPFLFPSLERSMHDANYQHNFVKEDSGALRFRIQLPLGSKGGEAHACADGQFGAVMHVYREWKISGNDEWLKSLWPKLKRALEYAWEYCDEYKSGYLDKWQHNTYDIELYGPNTFLTCYYLGALKAGAEIASYLGEIDTSSEYMGIFEEGQKWVEDNLFNGEYYVQKYDPKQAKRYQIGQGCLIDQLVGQQLARVAGLGYILKPENVKTTLKSIFKYNWKPNMREHENAARIYAINDEAGTINCTWPKGARPNTPSPYTDEVWNGAEYQFAAHCIMEGLLEEGLTVIKSVRDRYDGYGRNPWDEFECGHHYARSMASYGILIALSGFEFDKRQKYLGFYPSINQTDFKAFWSLDGVWGTYSQSPEKACIEVLYGELVLKTIKLPFYANIQNFKLITPEIQYDVNFDRDGQIILPETIILKPQQKLILKKKNL